MLWCLHRDDELSLSEIVVGFQPNVNAIGCTASKCGGKLRDDSGAQRRSTCCDEMHSQIACDGRLRVEEVASFSDCLRLHEGLH